MLQINNLNGLIVNNVYFLEALNISGRNLKLKIKIIGFRIYGLNYETLLTNYPSDHDNDFQISIVFEILEPTNQHVDPRLHDNPYFSLLGEYRLIPHWINNKYILYKPETEEITITNDILLKHILELKDEINKLREEINKLKNK